MIIEWIDKIARTPQILIFDAFRVVADLPPGSSTDLHLIEVLIRPLNPTRIPTHILDVNDAHFSAFEINLESILG
jgi:hypothetical protein